MKKLVRVTAPRFCAGMEIEGEKIVWTAPILRAWRGQKFGWFQLFAAGQKWKLEIEK